MKRSIILLAVLLAACSNGQPQASLELKIAISPAAQPASGALLACLPADESIAITIDSVYPAAVNLAEYDFYIRLGEPEAAPKFAAQLATEQIVVIINPEQDLNSLSLSEVAELFAGRSTNWGEVGGEDEAVTLWVGPDSDEARVAFRANVLRGALAGTANIAGDPAGLLAAVNEDSSAAGVLPAAWLNDAVQAIDLDLTLPLLAVATAEPQGAARETLACMQTGAGQPLLAEIYAPFEP